MGGKKMDLVVMQGNLNTRRYIVGVLHPHVIQFFHNQGPGVISNVAMQDPTLL